jgi:hypothetical protein
MNGQMCCVQLCYYAKFMSRGGALARFPATPLGGISTSPINTIHQHHPLHPHNPLFRREHDVACDTTPTRQQPHLPKPPPRPQSPPQPLARLGPPSLRTHKASGVSGLGLSARLAQCRRRLAGARGVVLSRAVAAQTETVDVGGRTRVKAARKPGRAGPLHCSTASCVLRAKGDW